jgi:hypothetical protein
MLGGDELLVMRQKSGAATNKPILTIPRHWWLMKQLPFHRPNLARFCST